MTLTQISKILCRAPDEDLDLLLALHAAVAVGMPVSERRGSGYCWNGKNLRIKYLSKADEIAHEVGHFIVASNHERKRCDFGLGPNPNDPPKYPGREFDISPDRDLKYRLAKEAKASVAGILVMAFMDMNNIYDTCWCHGWLVTKDVRRFDKVAKSVLSGRF